MNEILLCKCANSVMAHQVIRVLEGEKIAFRQHDELVEPRAGVYGPTPGIAFYVGEGDFNRAWALVDPILKSAEKCSMPFCPRCGSEDVRSIQRNRYSSSLLLFSIFLFIAPCVYLYFSKGTESRFMYYLCLAVFLSSFVFIYFGSRKSADFKCNHCGKKFNRL